MPRAPAEPTVSQPLHTWDIGTQPDTPLALVVGHSKVNSIVVARIVERSGLRALPETPDMAIDRIDAQTPWLVIIDESLDAVDHGPIINHLADLRANSPYRLPCVIVLSTRLSGTVEPSSVIDAVVAKPILPEKLQPVVERLMARMDGKSD